MKTDATQVLTESTFSGDKVAMTIAEEATAHVMDVLTNLYSDPELAIIREPSTNAWDAHVAAGETRPIEVTTPHSYIGDQTLRIRDYGVGMSVEDIHNIYSRYGASTKRDSNDYNGSLGMGCKSPLAYAPSFTVISVKDGVRITVLVGRDEDGGTMEIVDTSATDEPNGTEVIIAVKRFNEITRKAQAFFSYWKPGTVLLNGEEPAKREVLHQVTDNIAVIKGGSSRLVMGNVPYPIDPERFKTGLSDGYSLVVHVDIGEVSFAPSREALRYTLKTRETLDRILKEFKGAVEKSIQDKIDGCAKGHEAIEAIVSSGWLASTKDADFTFKGKKVPRNVEDPDRRIIYAQPDDYKLASHSRVPFIHRGMWPKVLWVAGYDAPTFTAVHKKKLDKYVRDNNLNVKHYVMAPKLPVRMWLNPKHVVKWETIKAIKLPRNGRSRDGHIPGSYEVLIPGNSYPTDMTADKIRDYGGPVFWAHREGRGKIKIAQRLRTVLPDNSIIVLLPDNRVAKFERWFPKVEKANAKIQNLYDSWAKKLNKSDLTALAIHENHDQGLKNLDEKRILDPELKAAIRAAGRDITRHLAKREAFAKLHVRTSNVTWVNPLDKYPLVSWSDFNKSWHTDETKVQHAYHYVNCAYKAMKEGKL